MYKFNPRLIFYKDIHSYYDKEKVNEVINKIENNEKNVILIGKKNSGKSKVLKEFNEQNKENNIGSFLINDSFIIENMEKEEIISRIELLIYKKFYNMLSEKSKGKLNWLNINIDSEFKKTSSIT